VHAEYGPSPASHHMTFSCDEQQFLPFAPAKMPCQCQLLQSGLRAAISKHTQPIAEWRVAAIQHVRLVNQMLENFFLFTPPTMVSTRPYQRPLLSWHKLESGRLSRSVHHSMFSPGGATHNVQLTAGTLPRNNVDGIHMWLSATLRRYPQTLSLQ
jgi:hypothetical protein